MGLINFGLPNTEDLGRLQVTYLPLAPSCYKYSCYPLVSFLLNLFYTLQIIRNTDLEELTELGSGTFGTVYHGKWRGSDVAIKRINDRCFAGKPSEQDKMVRTYQIHCNFLLSFACTIVGLGCYRVIYVSFNQCTSFYLSPMELITGDVAGKNTVLMVCIIKIIE